MKTTILATILAAVLASSAAFAGDVKPIGLETTLGVGASGGSAIASTGVIYKHFGGDFWAGGDKYGSDLKVSIPAANGFDLVAEVGVAIQDRKINPAAGGGLSYKIPVSNAAYQGMVVGAGYHTEKGINGNVGFYW